MSDYVKFVDNQSECVELAFDQPLEGTNQFGKKQFTYGIKPLITGEEKFSATEKLHEKIQDLKVKSGDTIYIEKIKKPDVNSGYAFFKVTMQGVPLKKQPVVEDKGAANFEKQFETPDQKMEKHELTLRVDRLEEIVAKLQQSCKKLMDDYDTKMSEAGHKPGDEKIPF